jgi:uncharacterized protein YggU (UPF0235/DUF167 family)
VRISVVAHPGVKVERVVLLADDSIGVWVRARAVEGQANVAIERLLANALGLKVRQVKIVSGLMNRRKIVDIDLPSLDVIRGRLRPDS